ncbi:uncharacterized protein L969DRAFT_95736 [Mixia osmundae IAM 14324]|uniref:Uncharacterized protein n=1 Tax=Mixia osmundae (strain CBS 9802 / IAM 14324 / JCM 22182 / KY 12970) TaxID=764103 RepID=G7E0P7_MIXOS|nr:uncharacterized protein L969DRAFT_95736 [Mixia osmundae IAM 14324]KEI37883.1 hypothetical protein L969DRAFT_95736 [Mixia osmundae IAM 14324]GAA96407.1 hypothetical protein E5Q_03074 [Mixia osmundae IAM 14324]
MQDRTPRDCKNPANPVLLPRATVLYHANLSIKSRGIECAIGLESRKSETG